MTATGNITEDALAIQKLIAPGSRTTSGTFGPWPWVPAASEDDIRQAQGLFTHFDDDVVELLRVSEQFSAGHFVLNETVAVVSHGSLETPAAIRPLLLDYEGTQHFEPQGEILWFNTQPGFALGVEMGGPNSGRVIAPEVELGFIWKTLAWSLSDAVACTLELYEAGWYQWAQSPFWYPYGKPALTQEEMYPVLSPIIDRWNCKPLIAEFDESYHREPERPTQDRR